MLECKLQETVSGFERNTALLEGQYVSGISSCGGSGIRSIVVVVLVV